MPTSTVLCTNAALESWRSRAGRIALAGLGALIGLGTLGGLVALTGNAWLLGSFGASCVLLFGFPDAVFSRARNVVGGHVLSSLLGLACLQWLGSGWWAMAAAGACAAMLMMATDTVHPPAGSNPVIIYLSHPGWDFVLLPTLAGALMLLLISKVYWKLARSRS
nr:HPP family protein [uncultured Cupriavidus sp.]